MLHIRFDLYVYYRDILLAKDYPPTPIPYYLLKTSPLLALQYSHPH